MEKTQKDKVRETRSLPDLDSKSNDSILWDHGKRINEKDKKKTRSQKCNTGIITWDIILSSISLHFQM